MDSKGKQHLKLASLKVAKLDGLFDALSSDIVNTCSHVSFLEGKNRKDKKDDLILHTCLSKYWDSRLFLVERPDQFLDEQTDSHSTAGQS